MSQIPTDVLMNVILVNEGVRNAMLIQPQDYQEEDENGPKTSEILSEITNKFPELKFTLNYRPWQGIIVSKKSYESIGRISLEKMGQILGYPCYKDFVVKNPQESYSIRINAEYNGKTFELFTNVCLNTSKLDKFNKMSQKAQIALNKNGINCTTSVSVNKIPSYNSVFEKLLSDNEIPEDFIEFINNEFWNNFTYRDEGILPDFCYKIDYSNKIHRGMVIAFLLNFKHDKLSVFYPLKEPYNQLIDYISDDLEKETTKIIDRSNWINENKGINQGNGINNSFGIRNNKNNESINSLFSEIKKILKRIYNVFIMFNNSYKFNTYIKLIKSY